MAKRKKTHRKTVTVRVERYVAAVNATLTLGEPKELHVRDWITRTFEPNRFVANAPCEDFVTLEAASVDAIDVLLTEKGEEKFPSRDAFSFGWSKGGALITPTRCEHGLAMHIRYTGLVPDGFSRGSSYTFSLAFMGPSSESLRRAAETLRRLKHKAQRKTHRRPLAPNPLLSDFWH